MPENALFTLKQNITIKKCIFYSVILIVDMIKIIVVGGSVSNI